MDHPVFGIFFDFFAIVDGFSKYVEQTSKGLLSNRYFNSRTGSGYFHVLAKSFTCCQHQTTNLIISQMLRNFHNTGFSVVLHLQGIFDTRQISVFKYNVNNWSHDLYNTSFIHTCFHFLFRFWALAPAQTSVISCVIAACLALLYIIERSLMISCALSVADCIAVIRALCSLAYASTRHP